MPPLPTGTFLDTLPSAGNSQTQRAGPLSVPALARRDRDRVSARADGSVRAARVRRQRPVVRVRVSRPRRVHGLFQRKRAATRETATAPFNQTAYWIMNIDARVIKDHGDVWNLSTLSMLGAMMAPRGFFEPHTGRMHIQAK